MHQEARIQHALRKKRQAGDLSSTVWINLTTNRSAAAPGVAGRLRDSDMPGGHENGAHVLPTGCQWGHLPKDLRRA